MPCTLKVKIGEGRDLPIMDRSSALADAYVEIRCGQSDPQKTDIKRKTLNPIWNQDFRFDFPNEADLQDTPLDIRVWDYDLVSKNDMIGAVLIDLNCLLSNNDGIVGVNNQISGWFPIFDTLRGIRGELFITAKLDIIQNVNPFKDSSAGVQFFSISTPFSNYRIASIHGFVEELMVESDPEYHWTDTFRASRFSNFERQCLLYTLSGKIRRQMGKKVLEMGGNAVLGYKQHFDLEGDSGIVARGYGTAVTLRKLVESDILSPSLVSPKGFGSKDQQHQLLLSSSLSSSICDSDSDNSSNDSDSSDDSSSDSSSSSDNHRRHNHHHHHHHSHNNHHHHHHHHHKDSSSEDDNCSNGDNKSTSAINEDCQNNIETQLTPSIDITVGANLATASTAPSSHDVQLCTLNSFQSNLVIHIGGVVSVKSVKILKKSNTQAKRDRYWTEIRNEIKTHAHSLGCNYIIGYVESTAIQQSEDLCIFSATGTAVVLDLYGFSYFSNTNTYNNNTQTLTRKISKLEDLSGEDIPTVGSFKKTSMILPTNLVNQPQQSQALQQQNLPNTITSSQPIQQQNPGNIKKPITRSGSMSGSIEEHPEVLSSSYQDNNNSILKKQQTPNLPLVVHQRKGLKKDCSVCHIPYASDSSPFGNQHVKCAMCKKKYVPEILLATIEIPPGVPITGRGSLIQARVCKIKKKSQGNDNQATLLSETVPFIEYDLHNQLMYKLKVLGMNAAFGLKTQISFSDNIVIGIATATAVFLTPLPTPPVIQISRGPNIDQQQNIGNGIQQNIGTNINSNTSNVGGTGSDQSQQQQQQQQPQQQIQQQQLQSLNATGNILGNNVNNQPFEVNSNDFQKKIEELCKLNHIQLQNAKKTISADTYERYNLFKQQPQQQQQSINRGKSPSLLISNSSEGEGNVGLKQSNANESVDESMDSSFELSKSDGGLSNSNNNINEVLKSTSSTVKKKEKKKLFSKSSKSSENKAASSSGGKKGKSSSNILKNRFYRQSNTPSSSSDQEFDDDQDDDDDEEVEDLTFRPLRMFKSKTSSSSTTTTSNDQLPNNSKSSQQSKSKQRRGRIIQSLLFDQKQHSKNLQHSHDGVVNSEESNSTLATDSSLSSSSSSEDESQNEDTNINNDNKKKARSTSISQSNHKSLFKGGGNKKRSSTTTGNITSSSHSPSSSSRPIATSKKKLSGTSSSEEDDTLVNINSSNSGGGGGNILANPIEKINESSSAFVVAVDDKIDEDKITTLLDFYVQPGFSLCNTEILPGQSSKSIQNIRLITAIRRVEWDVDSNYLNKQLSLIFNSLYDSIMFKLRELIPCTICGLNVDIKIPEDDQLELLITAMCVIENDNLILEPLPFNLQQQQQPSTATSTQSLPPHQQQQLNQLNSTPTLYHDSTQLLPLPPISLMGNQPTQQGSLNKLSIPQTISVPQSSNNQPTTPTSLNNSSGKSPNLYASSSTVEIQHGQDNNHQTSVPHDLQFDMSPPRSPIKKSVDYSESTYVTTGGGGSSQSSNSNLKNLIQSNSINDQLIQQQQQQQSLAPPPKGNNVEMTPLSFLPSSRMDKYLGRINIHLIKESFSVREGGGLGVFSHVFMTEANAIVRAQVQSMGGNTLVGYHIDEFNLILDSGPKGQAYSLISISGDAYHSSNLNII